MRRLSMPVVAGAFSGDTKKTPTGNPPPGVASMAPPPVDERLAKRSFEKDGVGNFGHRRDNYAGGNSLEDKGLDNPPFCIIEGDPLERDTPASKATCGCDNSGVFGVLRSTTGVSARFL